MGRLCGQGDLLEAQIAQQDDKNAQETFACLMALLSHQR